jgi:predicted metal-dependent hydrolase
MCFEDYVLRRSARKSLAISIADAQVIVRAPFGLDLDYINAFVDKKRFWIGEKLKQQHQRLAEIPQRRFQQDECWPYLGVQYKLHLQSASRCCIRLLGEQLTIATPRRDTEYLKMKLQAWYKNQALQVFEEKVNKLSAAENINFESVKIRKTKTRWGHCTRDGVLQFNWLLIQAPEYVVDYVVAHELCHRVHFDHSAKFWALLDGVGSEVERAKQWLKRYGHTLSV